MAGSYDHIINGWSIIENMGDAYEAVEELMYLIQSQIGAENAGRILHESYYPMIRGEIPKDKYLKQVDKFMDS